MSGNLFGPLTRFDLWNGDCLELMKRIPDGSVDMICTDPPYGTVQKVADSDSISHGMKGKTDWDVAIDPKLIFEECNRVLRMNGALILFSQEPYTSRIITEAHGNLPFSYRMVWIKDHFANALIAKKAPVSYYEDIVVYFKKYDTLELHPLRNYAKRLFEHIGKDKRQIFDEMGHQGICHFMRHDSMQFGLCTQRTYSQLCEMYGIVTTDWFLSFDDVERQYRNFTPNKVFNLPEGKKYKSNVFEYKKDYDGFHPTQKPVALIKDLIETYSNSGETVLDFTMGSGTTGVACRLAGRSFIGIEKDPEYFRIAQNRIVGEAC